MVCFGIDPGIGRMGYGIVSQKGDALSALDYGVISTEPRTPLAERLNEIFLALEEKISRHNPDVIAVERLYFGKNTTTASWHGTTSAVPLQTVAENVIARCGTCTCRRASPRPRGMKKP